MNHDISSQLETQDLDPERFLRGLEIDEGVVRILVDGLTATNEVRRFNANTVLAAVAERMPEQVYPLWDELMQLISSANTYHRCAAINILPLLIPVDRENNFERMFDLYFLLLDDKSVIPPCYVARNAARIVAMKPEWRHRVVNKLLGIDQTRHEQGRKDLIKADIISALDEIAGDPAHGSAPEPEVTAFVRSQLQCSSPKTRKAAQTFLDRHGF
jgi:hypothetical protein